jgi:hypothetical protein
MNEAPVLNNPNVFQVEGSFTKGHEHPASIRCPHCHELGQFDLVHDLGISYMKKLSNSTMQGFFACLRICPNVECKGLVFVITRGGKVAEVLPPELIQFNVEDLPESLERTLKEAVACNGAGAHRAAAMMVRRLLEEICAENNAEGDNLHKRLAALKGKVVLPQMLFEAMDELKLLGNDAAHIEAREYDDIGPKQAEAAIELAQEVVKSLYQLKALITKLRNGK